MVNNIVIILGVLSVVCVLGYVVYRKNIRTKKVFEDSIAVPVEKIEERIKHIEKKFINHAIGFYLQEKAFELNLDKKTKEEMFRKLGYGEEFSSPIIDWSQEFNFMKDNISERDDFIKVYLETSAGKDFCNESEFILNCFERYLLIQAKERSDKLVINQ